jgi:hypothetical protein
MGRPLAPPLRLLLLPLSLAAMVHGAIASTITVASMNILAPSWMYGYPSRCSALHDTFARQQRSLAFIAQHLGGADVIALQETEQATMPLLRQGLEVLGYSVAFAEHDDAYWARFVVDGVPFHSNGVALAVRTNRFDNCSTRVVALGDAGNRAVRARRICARVAVSVAVSTSSPSPWLSSLSLHHVLLSAL